MTEAFPILAAIALGLAFSAKPPPLFLRAGALVLAAVAAAALSGELARDWRFALFDLAEVATVFTITLAIARSRTWRAWSRRLASWRSAGMTAPRMGLDAPEHGE